MTAAALIAVALVGLGAAAPGDLPEQAKGKAKGHDKEKACQEAFDVPEVPTSLELVGRVDLPGSALGIFIDEARCLLLWTGDTDPGTDFANGFKIFDIRDPRNPVQLGSLEWGDILTAAGPKDVEMLVVDERIFAVVALEGGESSGVGVIDVTDPANPRILVERFEYWAHNLGTFPGTPYVYPATMMFSDASTQGKTDRVIPILDVSDPENPVWHTAPIPLAVNGVPVTTDGCHDVTVRPDLGRAYCAAGGGAAYAFAGGQTFIWNVTDPLAPDWIGVIDNPFVTYHHAAIASPDGHTLYVGDEFWPMPNCQPGALSDAGYRQRTGAVWIYDISDPANPQERGFVQANDAAMASGGLFPGLNCGAHFGDVVDDTGFLVWGWYTGGTLLIDARDPANPTIADRSRDASESGNANWDAQYFNGHVYVSSQGGGCCGSPHHLAVYRLVG